ncbi:excalibur calcium-binding domain-containing protein [Streptomyces sp. NPDC002795]|uniref:excalibur calcium-binding domain-containing protein n=1 Tax=Streptomyces sp. NPDC002795 TaxID=3364665 RepID=UPI0036A77FF7
MRVKSVLLASAVAGAALIPTSGMAYAAPDRDCPDFSTQAEAQAYYDAHPGDPDRLDRDDDGQACEDGGLPPGSDSDADTSADTPSDTPAMPKDGVKAGAGGLSEDGSATALPIGFAAAAVLAAGGAVVLRRRAKQDH